MKRGDLLSVIVPGDYGKPRPAVVVQTNLILRGDSVIVCLITGDLTNLPSFRVPLPVNARTGLRKPSQIMPDKLFTSYREKCGPVFGRLNSAELAQLDEALAFFLGLGDP